MKTLWIAVVALVASPFVTPRAVFGQATVARELIEQAAEQLVKQSGKEGLRELTAMGGETVVREILEQSAREGGEPLVKKVTQYGLEHGPIALRVIRRGPRTMVDALDGLPPELRDAGIRAVERNPGVMTPLITAYGAPAMEVAARHPGVGDTLVQTLGSDGIELGRKLTSDQAIVAARHTNGIATLPPGERASVVARIAQSPTRALAYLERHPKVLLTTAGVATFLAMKDDLVGKPGATSPGLIERLAKLNADILSRPLLILSVAISLGVLGWFGIHLCGKWRLQRLRTHGLQATTGKPSPSRSGAHI